MSEAIQAAIEESRAREKLRHVPYGDLHLEYAFREALAVAVEKLQYLARQPHGQGATVCEGKQCFYKEYAAQALPELEAILSGKEAT